MLTLNKTQNESEIFNNFYIRMRRHEFPLVSFELLFLVFYSVFPSSSHHRPHRLIVRVPFFYVLLCYVCGNKTIKNYYWQTQKQRELQNITKNNWQGSALIIARKQWIWWMVNLKFYYTSFCFFVLDSLLFLIFFHNFRSSQASQRNKKLELPIHAYTNVRGFKFKIEVH